MKLLTEAPSRKTLRTTLKTSPFTIWMTRSTALVIEKGDRLDLIAKELRKHWTLAHDEARDLAAYYFALGERRALKKKPGPWKKDELDTRPLRRYLSP